MDRKKFSQRYKRHEKRLNYAGRDLVSRIDRHLKAYQDTGDSRTSEEDLFRVRIKSYRVKKPDSLYEKIVNDERLSLDEAFQPGHVRDLIGVRIVCHNLRDVNAIASAIKQGKWRGLVSIDPESGPKHWIEKGNPASGYRGWHLDIVWTPRGRKTEEHAELQIRTLLQDAWATFMHDDVYKRKAKKLLSRQLFSHLGHFSDLLFTLDVMAEQLREAAESGTLSGYSHIRVLDAIRAKMYALVDFQQRALVTPQYEHVVRQDHYLVRGENGVYRFTLQGKGSEPSYFVLAVGGDTDPSNFKLNSLSRFSRGEARPVPENQRRVEIDSQGRNTVFVKDGSAKRKNHQYRLECEWNGIFENDLEYLWCPWRDLYCSSAVDYTLEVEFESIPKKRPVLFILKDNGTLGEIFDRFEEKPDGDVECKVLEERKNKSRYTFAPKEGKENFICLFQR